MNDKQEECGDTDLATIALPRVTHTCHFLPPAPLLTLLSRASAPPPPAQVWRTPPAFPPGLSFHAPAPHPTLGPGAPVQSAAAHHFPAQYQAPAVFTSAHAQTDAFASAPAQTLNVYFPFHLPLGPM